MVVKFKRVLILHWNTVFEISSQLCLWAAYFNWVLSTHTFWTAAVVLSDQKQELLKLLKQISYILRLRSSFWRSFANRVKLKGFFFLCSSFFSNFTTGVLSANDSGKEWAQRCCCWNWRVWRWLEQPGMWEGHQVLCISTLGITPSVNGKAELGWFVAQVCI